MRLAKNALAIALTMLTLVFAASAQLRSEEDPRNTAPTVGTGGPVGGPTGLFTVYDGTTLRKGEFTFSVAYSNFDRDPGDVDIVEVPVSFQVGLTDRLEVFFNTDAYRAVKVNSPLNLSSFRLPNTSSFGLGASTVNFPGFVQGQQLPAIILAPGSTGPFAGQPIFRPAGAPFAGFPFFGSPLGSLGNFFTGPLNNIPIFTGPIFGFPAGTNAIISGDFSGGFFPGLGSPNGSILPGVVFSTVNISNGGTSTIAVPVAFTSTPIYLPDAPLINRRYGTSSFSTLSAGAKWRFTSNSSPYGVGIIPFYRWYADEPNDDAGFNQLQRGSSAGGGCFPTFGCFNPFDNRGDLGIVLFADARLRRWLNLSGNIGYVFNSDIKFNLDDGNNDGDFDLDDFDSDSVTLLDRPNEILYGVALDMPVNRYFQGILEFRGTYYQGGQDNALENNPMDGIAGIRIFPRRWFGFGAAYRIHFNQQDRGFFEDSTFSNVNADRATFIVSGPGTGTTAILPITTTTGSLANVARFSSDPHGFIGQFWIGRRDARGLPSVPNQPANVESITLDRSSVTLPCPPGQQSASGSCPDNTTVGVTTVARDPENDVLTYSYTVSGGRIVGQGANVSWDLSGVRPGTYTITSAVDDGCGFCGQTKTTTITVTECPDCVTPPRPCECPTISVSGPSDVIRPGTSITFTANVSGGTDFTPGYNWSVSAGTITSGQGTPVITVDTTGLSSTNVTATVNVGGTEARCNCDSTGSATAQIAAPPEVQQIDEFGRLSNNDIKIRLDALANALQSDPSATGVIITNGPPREVSRRETVMRNYLTQNRGVDPGRLTFINSGPETPIRTRLFLVPSGATPPTQE